MGSPRDDFVSGVTDILPLLPGFLPVGVLVGYAAVNVGMPPLQAMVMSLTMFAGASQLAMIELLGVDAPVVIVVATGLLVNLRFAMYSAGIAPYFRHLSAGWKRLLAYFLVDSAFALSVTEFERNAGTDRRWYYLGTALPGWINWQAATAVGAFLGPLVPAGLGLDFAVPLAFMALLAPTIEDRSTGSAAAVSAVVAVAAYGLPYNLGLVTAALCGVAAGLATEVA